MSDVSAPTAPELATPATDDALTPPTFDVLPLSPETRACLDKMGYVQPTPVQRAVFEPASRGKDLVVQARTGTGKTAAFGLPIVEHLVRRSQAAVQTLVLCPTRELALQVAAEIERLGEGRQIKTTAIYGGASMVKQVEAIQEGAQVIVGTPGRVLDHIKRGTFKPATVRALVLDEADEMLSMGFERELTAIIDALPKERQTLLFSATLPPDIERMAREKLRQPEFITLSSDAVGALSISHFVYFVLEDKLGALIKVLEVENPESAIIFCNMKVETEIVTAGLRRHGYDADWLNGDLPQNEREEVVSRIRNGSLRFLVATDVAARGIDISHLTHVINYDFPDNTESYVHRTGRTGRAGRTGTAISLVSPQSIGSLYFLRLAYNIRPFERFLPTASELKTRREADLVTQVIESFASQKAHPDDLRLARRLLSHDQAEQVLALLLRERLGPRETAEDKAAAARRARNPLPPREREREPAAEGAREERSFDRGPRSGGFDRGGRGGERGGRGGDRGDRGGFDRGGRGERGGRGGDRGGFDRGPSDRGGFDRGPRGGSERGERSFDRGARGPGEPAVEAAEAPASGEQVASAEAPAREARGPREGGSRERGDRGRRDRPGREPRSGSPEARDEALPAFEIADAPTSEPPVTPTPSTLPFTQPPHPDLTVELESSAGTTPEVAGALDALGATDAVADAETPAAAPGHEGGGRAPRGGAYQPREPRAESREAREPRAESREAREPRAESREAREPRAEGAPREGGERRRRRGSGRGEGPRGGAGFESEDMGIRFTVSDAEPVTTERPRPAELSPERPRPNEFSPERSRSAEYTPARVVDVTRPAAPVVERPSDLVNWHPAEEEGDDRPILHSEGRSARPAPAAGRGGGREAAGRETGSRETGSRDAGSREASGGEGGEGEVDDADFAVVFVDVGRREGVRPSDLQRALRDVAGIGRRDTGRIRVRDRHSLVAVRRDLLGQAVERLTGAEIAGRTVRAEQARERTIDGD